MSDSPAWADMPETIRLRHEIEIYLSRARAVRQLSQGPLSYGTRMVISGVESGTVETLKSVLELLNEIAKG